MTSKLQPDESHAHQAEEDYQKILAGLLKKTTDSARQKGFELNNNTALRIFISGKETHRRDLTPAYINKLRQAIEAPESLKGSVQIKIGKEMVYYVKDGVVVRDLLGLTQKQQKVEVKQNVSSLTSEPVVASVDKPDKSLITHEQLVQRLNSLEESVKRQSAQFNQLERNLAKILQSSSSVQNKSLSQWMSSTLSGIVSSFKQALEGWNNAKEQVIGKIKQRVEVLTGNPNQQQFQSLEKLINSSQLQLQKQIKNIRDELAYLQKSSISEHNKTVIPQVDAKFNATEIVSAVEKLLEKIKTQQLDGTRFFRAGSGYLFEGKGNTINISSPNGNNLITSRNIDGDRQIDISTHLKDIELSQLQKIANKIERDLSAVSTHNKERKVSLSRAVGFNG